VPQVPFTLEFPGDINTPNPLSALANPRLATIFAVLKPLVDNARNTIVDHARQRLQPKAVALAQRVAVAPVPQAELAVYSFDVTVLPSLNFVTVSKSPSLGRVLRALAPLLPKRMRLFAKRWRVNRRRHESVAR
jgi:hypothetical protein